MTAPQRGNPAGRFFNNTQDTIGAGPTQITTLTNDYLKGGMTFGSNALTVPVTGIYAVTAYVAFSNTAGSAGPANSGMYTTTVERNASAVRTYAEYAPGGNAQILSVGGTDLISLTANDALTLFAGQNSGSNQGVFPGTGFTWLAAALVSQ